MSKLDLNICSNEKFKLVNCSKYSLDSILKDLCISCKEGFYQIYNDSLNIYPYIKCYKDPERYFFDKTINKYKSCFLSCQTCNKEGDNISHNCLTCKEKYKNELYYNNYINCYDICPFNFYYNINLNKTICTINYTCTNDEYNKKILDRNECIKNCSNDDEYKFEYMNTCNKICPENTKESEINPFSCEILCSQEFPFLIKSTQECVSFCSINDLIQKNCIINIKINNLTKDNNNETASEAEQKILDNIQQELINGFDVSNIDNGTEVYITGINSLFTITNTLNQRNQKNSSKTSIDFKNCENNLKSFYNISEKDPFYILKIDKYEKDSQIPLIEYELYFPLNTNNSDLVKLNLSICQNDKIDLYYSVQINESNLDKYDINSDYYKDICYSTTSDKGTDINLEDRKKEYVNNNLSIYGENCQLVEYDRLLNKSKCNCDIKIQIPFMSEITINKTKLLESFSNIKNNINIKIIKCYKILFSKKGIKNNIGFFIFISVIFLLLILLIIFLTLDYRKLKNKIDILFFTKKNWKKIKQKFKSNNKKAKLTITNNNDDINNNNIDERKKRRNKNKDNNNIDNNKGININHEENNNNAIYTNNLNKNNIININNNIKNKGNEYSSRKNLINSLNTINPTKNKLKRKSKNKKKRKGSNKKRKNNTNLGQTPFIEKLTINKPFEYYENIMNPNDTELNNISYIKAIKSDKRTYCQYYLSLLKTRHILIFAFFFSNDYNSQIIKIYLFFFISIMNFSINSLFFNDSTMHVIYEDNGDFNFVYQIPQIMASSLISGILTSIFKVLSLSENNVLSLKQKKGVKNLKKKKEEVMEIIRIKFISFFVLSFLAQILFGFYVSCFCAVYINTQIHLIKDFLISFGFSMFYPFGVYLIPGIFRIYSLRSEKRNKNCLYDFSKLFQMF